MCASKPKVPKPAPVIQRQAYRSPAPRDTVASSDPNRRRRIPGVATSAQGDTSIASTTRKSLGGDQALNPSIGGGNGAGVASGVTQPSPSTGVAPVIQAVANKRGRPPSWKLGGSDVGMVL